MKTTKTIKRRLPKPHHIYKELDPSWFRYLLLDYQSYPLPTEVVIREPQFVVPQMGRIYRTGLMLEHLPGSREAVDTVVMVEHYPGSREAVDTVVMVEHYCNRGDDGHTEMELEGYIFVPATEAKFIVDEYGRKVFAYEKVLRDQYSASFTKKDAM